MVADEPYFTENLVERCLFNLTHCPNKLNVKNGINHRRMYKLFVTNKRKVPNHNKYRIWSCPHVVKNNGQREKFTLPQSDNTVILCEVYNCDDRYNIIEEVYFLIRRFPKTDWQHFNRSLISAQLKKCIITC